MPSDIRGPVPPLDEEPCPILALVRVPHSAAGCTAPELSGADSTAAPALQGSGSPAAAGSFLVKAAAPMAPAAADPGSSAAPQTALWGAHPPAVVERSFGDWLARLQAEAGAESGVRPSTATMGGSNTPRHWEEAPWPEAAVTAAGVAAGELPSGRSHTRDPRNAQQAEAQPSTPHSLQQPPQPASTAPGVFAGTAQLAVGSAEAVRAAAACSGEVFVTLLVPARRGLRGAFPLNGTYCALAAPNETTEAPREKSADHLPLRASQTTAAWHRNSPLTDT